MLFKFQPASGYQDGYPHPSSNCRPGVISDVSEMLAKLSPQLILRMLKVYAYYQAKTPKIWTLAAVYWPNLKSFSLLYNVNTYLLPSALEFTCFSYLLGSLGASTSAPVKLLSVANLLAQSSRSTQPALYSVPVSLTLHTWPAQASTAARAHWATALLLSSFPCQTQDRLSINVLLRPHPFPSCSTEM